MRCVEIKSQHLFLSIFFYVTAALAVSACSMPSEMIRREPRSIARDLGFPGCRVSIPLTKDDVIEVGREWELYTDPLIDPEWDRFVSAQRSGDQLRLVDCKKGRSFYGAFRNGKLVSSYYPLTLD